MRFVAIIKDGRFPGSTAIQVGNKRIQYNGINEFNCENQDEVRLLRLAKRIVGKLAPYKTVRIQNVA